MTKPIDYGPYRGSDEDPVRPLHDRFCNVPHTPGWYDIAYCAIYQAVEYAYLHSQRAEREAVVGWFKDTFQDEMQVTVDAQGIREFIQNGRHVRRD